MKDDRTFQEKARQNLTVTEWCYKNKHYDACCNRAYYAMFHAAIAILAREGMTPSQANISHIWVQSNFVTYFCNRNKIFPRFRNYLQDAQEKRNLADYQPEHLGQKRTKRQLYRANEFVQALLGRLDHDDDL